MNNNQMTLENSFETALSDGIKTHLSACMEKAGFAYQQRHHIFMRTTDEAVQRIHIYTDRNPHGSETAYASIVPKIHIEMPTISELAMDLVERSRALLPAHKFIVAMPAESCLQKSKRQRWYVDAIEDIDVHLTSISSLLDQEVLPFVLSFDSTNAFTAKLETSDNRLRMDQRMYIFWVAAKLLQGKIAEAEEIAVERFGRGAAHPRYQAFLTNVAAYRG